jgi:hypothetical protein
MNSMITPAIMAIIGKAPMLSGVKYLSEIGLK